MTIYYANPCTDEYRDMMSAGRLGCITTPKQGNIVFPDDGWDVIADNGCYTERRWSFRSWFDWLLEQPRTIRFAVCPDVFDRDGRPTHDETLERWREWSPRIERAGFTPAFVCQVGCTVANVPDAPVLFLGGTDAWKTGPAAWAIATAGADQGRWVHMGRVNSRRRFRTARMMHCHSADGTYATFGPDTNLPKMMSWLVDAERAPTLWNT